MPKVLSPLLLAAIERYSAAREARTDLAKPIVDFIAATGDQSPASIADADGAIASAARLWSWSRKLSWFERNVFGKRADRDLLDEVPGLAYLFLFHKNGFLRQAALERISGPISNAFLVAALAWRRNDWVDQVRASAKACMDRCLPSTSPDVLAEFFLETAGPRSTWRRWSDAQRQSMDALLARPEVAAEIVAQLLMQRDGPLPSWLRYLLRYEWIDPYLKILASEAKIPGVRAVALQALAYGFARSTDGSRQRFWIDKPMGIIGWRPHVQQRALTIHSDRSEAIRSGLQDCSTAVRKVALEAIMDRASDDTELVALAEPFLNDRSACIRSKAAFIVERVK
ncbi:hypothetical protein [Parerythrobacter lacustris]|uniref:HEAT repeat domain-containing protein n=1 Tax=Parerythrobacter lacustris TaxID=2969984 RepID=A0ABT1XP72_9SPHN|nr:hypothetical protein [Parerythrobacter lacustris]MCR2833017.1 hypothetical protein [Parerythrobacter lacustris]